MDYKGSDRGAILDPGRPGEHPGITALESPALLTPGS